MPNCEQRNAILANATKKRGRRHSHTPSIFDNKPRLVRELFFTIAMRAPTLNLIISSQTLNHPNIKHEKITHPYKLFDGFTCQWTGRICTENQ